MHQSPEPRNPASGLRTMSTAPWNLALQGSCAEITHGSDRDLTVRLRCSGNWCMVGDALEIDVTPQDFRALADAMDTANEHSAAVIAQLHASAPADGTEVTR